MENKGQGPMPTLLHFPRQCISVHDPEGTHPTYSTGAPAPSPPIGYRGCFHALRRHANGDIEVRYGWGCEGLRQGQGNELPTPTPTV